MQREELVYEEPIELEGHEPQRFWAVFLKVSSAALTVMAGIALAVIAILLFRAPAKVIIRVPEFIKEPPPPPEVVTKEVIREVIKEPPPAPPPPPVVELLVRNSWERIRRPKRSQLPMFRLKNMGGMVAGHYAAQTGRVLSFRGGRVIGDSVELVVDDSLFRVRFGLRTINSASMKVEAWITDEDWLISLSRANALISRATGSRDMSLRQQAVLVAAQLQESIKWTRKVASLGVFYRGSEN